MLPWMFFTGAFWRSFVRSRDVQVAIDRTYEKLWSDEYAFERAHEETFDLGESGA